MSSLSSNPKAFIIFASRGRKSGFLRFMSYVNSKDAIDYKIVFVKAKSSASRFLNFDSTKDRALKYTELFSLSDVKVIDCSTGRSYNVKVKKTAESEHRES